MHVHEFGIREESDNETIRCGSAGQHFNPTSNTHGDLFSINRHTGDFGKSIYFGY